MAQQYHILGGHLRILFIIPILLVAVACTAPEPAETPTPTPTVIPIETPTAEPTPDGSHSETMTLPTCDCEAPIGTLAPHNAQAPAFINSTTPKDTFVAGTPPMRGDFAHGWSKIQSDLAVVELTSGYMDTCYVTPDGQILINESVVCKYTTEYDEDRNKTYNFTLHKHLKWNNGGPITSVHYVAGLLTYASPQFAAVGGLSTTGDGLLGFEAYHLGEIIGSEQAKTRDKQLIFDEHGEPVMVDIRDEPAEYFKGVRFEDELNFSVTIDASELPFFWELSFVNIRPVYMADWFPGNVLLSGSQGTRFANPIDEDLERIAATERFAPTVTCGPYKFVSFEDGEVVLRRNEYFGICYDGYVPNFDYIVQKQVSKDKGIELLLAGEIDYIAGVDAGALSAAIDAWIEAAAEESREEPEVLSEPVRLHKYPRAGYGFLELALDYGPTADWNVRLAVDNILNRYAFGSEGVPAHGDYSTAQWVAQSLPPQVYKGPDISSANKLLDDTGWVFESDGETPFDAELAKEDGSYLRHNELGEPLNIVAASASESICTALEEAMSNAPLAGMGFEIELITMPVLLDHYYNSKTWEEDKRIYHAFQLARDFTPVDDKFWSVHSSLADTPINSNGIRDDELDRLVMAMRSLAPEQTEEYAGLWLEYQNRYREICPSLPLYVSIYTDAYNNIITGVPTTAFAPYHSVITQVSKFD